MVTIGAHTKRELAVLFGGCGGNFFQSHDQIMLKWRQHQAQIRGAADFNSRRRQPRLRIEASEYIASVGQIQRYRTADWLTRPCADDTFAHPGTSTLNSASTVTDTAFVARTSPPSITTNSIV